MNMPPTQTIKHETGFWPFFLLLSILASAFFYWTLGVETEPGDKGSPELSFAFSLIAVGVSLWAIFMPPRIILSPYGFSYRALWNKIEEDWLDISALRKTSTSKGKPVLTYNYQTEGQQISKIIEYNFGHDVIELAELMNKYRRYAWFAETGKIDDA